MLIAARWLALLVILPLVILPPAAAVAAPAAEVPTLPDGRWHLEGTASVAVCGPGRCARSQDALVQEVDVVGGNVVGTVAGTGTCGGRPIDREVLGRYASRRQGGWKLRGIDRDGLERELRRCTGYEGARLQRVSSWLVVAPDARGFETLWRMRVGLRAEGRAVTIAVVLRVRGVLRSPAADQPRARMRAWTASRSPSPVVEEALPRSTSSGSRRSSTYPSA